MHQNENENENENKNENENEIENGLTPWLGDERLGSHAGRLVDLRFGSRFHSSYSACCESLVDRWLATTNAQINTPFTEVQNCALGQHKASSGKRCAACTALTALLQPHIELWAKSNAEIRVQLMGYDDKFHKSPVKFRLIADGSEESRLVEFFWPSEHVSDTEVKGKGSFSSRICRVLISVPNQKLALFPENGIWKSIERGSLVLGPQWIASTKSWVKHHIEECITSHDQCPSSTDSFLPTRVLAIQKTAINPKVHLHVSRKEEQARYACLSHCWGDASQGHIPLRTIHANDVLERFRSNIPWEDLPCTFRDAIVVALELGVEYLWIDSLCIIQDDDEDWRREAPKMSEVYANALFTISATTSPHPQGGLFGTTQTTQRQQCHFPIMAPAGNATLPLCSRIGAQHWWHGYPPGSDGPKRSEVDPSDTSIFPLMSRGWVFQERILSPRVLHFSRDEVVLECAYGNTCQCFGTWQQGTSRRRGLLKPYFSAQQLSSPGDGYQALLTALVSWQQALERYSILKFSFWKDRVIALAGVAQIFLPVFKGKYFAGAWEDVLVSTLAWRLQDSGVNWQLQPHEGLLLPSWSPLSSPGLIMLEDDVVLEETVEIISFPGGRTVEDLTGMSYGKISMVLSIRAHSLPTKLTRDNEGLLDFSDEFDITDIAMDYNIPTEGSTIDILLVSIGYYNRMVS